MNTEIWKKLKNRRGKEREINIEERERKKKRTSSAGNDSGEKSVKKSNINEYFMTARQAGVRSLSLVKGN